MSTEIAEAIQQGFQMIFESKPPTYRQPAKGVLWGTRDMMYAWGESERSVRSRISDPTFPAPAPRSKGNKWDSLAVTEWMWSEVKKAGRPRKSI